MILTKYLLRFASFFWSGPQEAPVYEEKRTMDERVERDLVRALNKHTHFNEF